VGLPVEWHHGDHDTGEPAERKDEEHAEDEQRRDLELKRPRAIVAIQANTWIPLGTETAMLAAEKKLKESGGMPVANMWCTQRPKLKKPVATSASTTSR
jgi:hypothetical protein